MRFGSFWEKWVISDQAKSNHLQAAFTKSMCTAVSWSRWRSILDLLGSFTSIWVGDIAPGRILVKMKINFGSFGLFYFNLSWGYCTRKDFGNLEFWGSSGKKFKFRRMENMGYGCRNGSISEKVQKFGKRRILMKYSLLYRGLSGNIWFLKIFTWFVGGAKVWVEKSFFHQKI